MSVFLFLGNDVAAKDQKLAAIKTQVGLSKESEQFDFQILHSYKLSAEELKRALCELPAMAPKRVLLITDIDHLDKKNKEIVFEFLKDPSELLVLILDFEGSGYRNAFVGKIMPFVEVVKFKSDFIPGAFDLTKKILSKDAVSALDILHKLLDQGDHPLKIMGAIVWAWKNEGVRMPRDIFRKGLLDIQEADFNIKRSRFLPDHVMDLLIVKLCS